MFDSFKNFAHRGAFFIIVASSSLILAFLPFTNTEAETVKTISTIPSSSSVFSTEKLAAMTSLSVAKTTPGTPMRLIIPAIGLDTSVVGLGIDKKGNMDVPSGKTTNVGWYKYGTVPGNTGTAVFDAHVFAAFVKLNNLKNGDDIYVVTNKNQKLHFVVGNAETYKLSALKSDTLFGNNGGKNLNLITCAGKLTADRSTYDHRLIVFTSYVGADSFVADATSPNSKI